MDEAEALLSRLDEVWPEAARDTESPMGFQIYGENATFATSSGGGQWLVDALAAVASRPGARDLSEVARLLHDADGRPAYLCFHPVAPAELDASGPLRDLGELVARVASELILERPRLPGTDFDRELRLQWVAKMANLHEMVCAAIQPASSAPTPLRLPLSARDQQEVEFERRRGRRYHARHGPLAEALAVEDTIVSLLLAQPPSAERDHKIALEYHERTMILSRRGLDQQAAYRDALRQTLVYERDEEMREAIEEVLTDTDWES